MGLLIDSNTKTPDGEELRWDTRVKDVLPDWQLMDKNTEANATIEDLLGEQMKQGYGILMGQLCELV